MNGEAATEAVVTRRFPTRGEAVPKGLKGLFPPNTHSPAKKNPAGVTIKRGRGAWVAPKRVGQINGLARNTTQTVRPGCVSLCAKGRS